MNVEKRADGWYAALTVPPDVREEIGRAKLLKKLSTISESKGRAAQEASPIIKAWKRDIKKIRDDRLAESSKSDRLKVIEEALQWKKDLASATDEDHGDEKSVLVGEFLERIEAIQDKLGERQAIEVAEIQQGKKTPLEPFYNEWAKSKLKSYSLKTADSYKRDALTFVDKFGYLEAINKRAIKEWISHLMEFGTDPNNIKPMTLTTLRDRFICGVRHFYNYLDTLGLVDDEKVNPLEGVIPKEEKTKKNLTAKGWEPFETEEVIQIYNAIPSNDPQLSTVTAIGMFTGMRIEEVCSLTLAQIIEKDGVKCFDIIDSKTKAGIRKVPIHSQLLPLIDGLLAESEDQPNDSYLISGLNSNKYGDRSNAVGKRFGRLKSSLGFGEKKVFHSIRKCVVTQLDRAGYRETSIADLVGHDNPNMTMGRYSAGIDIATRKPMVESIQYPTLVLTKEAK